MNSVTFEIITQPIDRHLKMKCETDKTINVSLSDIEKSPDISKLKSIYKLLGKETQGVPDSFAAVLARAENVENIDIRLPYESVSVASLRNTNKKLSENYFLKKY